MYATDFAQVGANIQKKLNEKGMTQQNLADKLGVSKQVMSKIIKGYKAINVNELSKIATILGTTTDFLLLVKSDTKAPDCLAFMGSINDEGTKNTVNKIRTAIDEIHMLEELLDEEEAY